LGHDVSELPFGDTVSVENNPGRLDALRFKQRERQAKKSQKSNSSQRLFRLSVVIITMMIERRITCLSFLFSSTLRMRLCGQQQGVSTTTKQKQSRTQNRTKKRTRVER
jgi:hypothetical protein